MTTAPRRESRGRPKGPEQGRPPPFLDAQIAAVAAVHDATVVTGNGSHFEMFEGLRVENWLA